MSASHDLAAIRARSDLLADIGDITRITFNEAQRLTGLTGSKLVRLTEDEADTRNRRDRQLRDLPPGGDMSPATVLIQCPAAAGLTRRQPGGAIHRGVWGTQRQVSGRPRSCIAYLNHRYQRSGQLHSDHLVDAAEQAIHNSSTAPTQRASFEEWRHLTARVRVFLALNPRAARSAQ